MIHTRPPSPSLATVAAQFVSRPGLATQTVKSYELALMPLLKVHGSWPIELLDRPTLEDYLNGLNYLAYTTHRRHQAIIQALFNFATQQGYLRANPVAHLQRRKPDMTKGEHGSDQVIRYLTQEQLQLLYQAIRPDLRLQAIVALLHRTGARIAEVLALDLADVDLENLRFQVLGKGNKQRWCFYSPDVAEVLNQYLRYERHPQHEALFTAQQQFTERISRLSYRAVHQHWKTAIQDIPQLADARLHDLRHTFATERVGLIALEELRALMGHEKIQTTLRYQKVTSGQAEAAAKRALETLLDES